MDTLYQVSPITGDLQACYSQAGCVGDIVTVPGPTARDCCAGTDDGESFSENDVNCTILQCVGTYSTTWLLCMAETESYNGLQLIVL